MEGADVAFEVLENRVVATGKAYKGFKNAFACQPRPFCQKALSEASLSRLGGIKMDKPARKGI